MAEKDFRMRKAFKGLLIISVLLGAYVLYVNRNSMDMTPRQRILKAAYPFLTKVNQWFSAKSTVLSNDTRQQPNASLYDIEVTLIDGSRKKMSDFRGRKLLIVNTASDCGFTGQLESLQSLYESGDLEIIGFPANDFKQQEKGTDSEIATFCKKNYGVSFPLATKGVVRKGPGQQPVFQWLTRRELNGWNGQAPEWNFSKYLVSEEGLLLNYFGPSVDPGDANFRKSIKQ
jgi:glutathione peroxidase